MNLRLYEKTCHTFLLAYLQSPESLQAYNLKVNLQKAPCTIKASYIRLVILCHMHIALFTE